MNNWTSRFLLVFLYSIFGIFGTQIPIPRKAINCTYFTTIIGREKNWKNHIEFSSVSSNIVSHQKPPSISEDFFFLFKNLRIACWSCVQKSNHRTRKSDFYCWNQSSSRLIFWVSMVSINFQNPNWLISITHHRHSQLKISKSSFEMCLIVQKVQEFFCIELRRFFSWNQRLSCFLVWNEKI